MKEIKKENPKNWKEFRRIQAIKLLEKGWTQQSVSEALNVSVRAICYWIKRYKENGKDGLKDKQVSRNYSRLTQEEKEKIPELLEKGAEHYGFIGNFWTQQRVADIIKREFGVSYHYTSAGRIVRSLGWTLQKPTRKAIQRDENVIKTWKEKKWPELKKKQKKKKGQ